WMTAVDDIDPAWVQALWQAWRKAFGTPSTHWAWHPYTASERVTNILSFARAYGLPGPLDDTLSVLAGHAPAIAVKLEYFGDHHTSNHLANNGMGLYFLGLMLDMENTAAIGLRILLEEAGRIILPSGVLREGSSHYHLLVLALYQKAAELASACGRPEAVDLSAICEKMKGPARALLLPGGLPLIGDISPDISPEKLLAGLDLEPAPAAELMVADGWLRFDQGPWSGLWHASPEGFTHMPGHGHQDMGGFELHHGNEPVLVDPGRGAYGETGEAAQYRSAEAHNGLSIDGGDPYPANRPYYDATFRKHIAGTPPVLTALADGVSLRYQKEKTGEHLRQWSFSGDRMTIRDDLTGTGKHRIVRRLISPLAAESSDGKVILQGQEKTYRLDCEGAEISLQPITCWRAYGQGAAGSMIVFSNHQSLPFQGVLSMEVL
ncbi:MAG: alginate lyase family protein, partial [Rhodospirillales bacterium]|nr:alginate lyase family protein [Rhodospirillales bacterium]